MAEPTYIGYQAPSQVNWNALSNKLSKDLVQIEQNRQAQRDALDKMAIDNMSMVNSWQPGKVQTLNEMILRGVDDARVKINSWNKDLKAGLITPGEYKTRMNNVSEYWGIMANNAKNYDARINEVMKRQETGDSGVLEAELLKLWSDSTDVKNNAISVADDGRVYMSGFNMNTKTPNGKVVDIRTLSIPDNIVSNKIKLQDVIPEYTKNWDPVTLYRPAGENIEEKSESVKNQQEYKLMKLQVADAIAPDSNPRAQVSVLGDNGVLDVQFYRTEDEYDQKYNELFSKLKQEKDILGEKITSQDYEDIKSSLVKLEQDETGVFNPVLTAAQRLMVKEAIGQNIDMQMEEKVSKDKTLEYEIALEQARLNLEKKKSASGGGGGRSTSDLTKAQQNLDKYLKGVYNAWKNRDWDTVNASLKGGTNGDARIRVKGGKYIVQLKGESALQMGAQAGQIGGGDTWVDFPIRNFVDLARYIDTGLADEVNIAKSISTEPFELDK